MITMDESHDIKRAVLDGKILSLGRPEFVQEIVEKAASNAAICPTGALSQVVNLHNTERLSDEDLLTALVYFGFLTHAPDSDYLLSVPNRAVSHLYR